MKIYAIILMLCFLTCCGCSAVTTPAFAYPGDNYDTWPCFFGTDNGGPDNGYMVFYDQGATAFDAPRLIANDLLDGQWTPQRQGIGWQTSGTWGVAFVEDTSNDLEYWESPDADWQDEAGAWGLTDDDATEDWEAVDAESRQNYVWLVPYEDTIPNIMIHDYYIDLAAGAPAITARAGAYVVDNLRYSMVLDQNLLGLRQLVVVSVGGIGYRGFGDIAITGATVTIAGEHPQIITDGEQRLWVFATNGNALIEHTSFNQPLDTVWDAYTIHSATILANNYHVTWLKFDDTIHVVLVDKDIINPNATTLLYMRRTPNGWDAPVTLLTVDSRPAGGNDDIAWPQITVDPYGAIFIYYIFEDVQGAGGDLRGFYLDAGVYATPVVGNWTNHTNIDASGTNVIWCVAPDSIIIGGDM